MKVISSEYSSTVAENDRFCNSTLIVCKFCSRIIVVHVHATGFSKVHPACHNIVNGIKPGSDSRKTYEHAVDRSKAVCWGVK